MEGIKRRAELSETSLVKELCSLFGSRSEKMFKKRLDDCEALPLLAQFSRLTAATTEQKARVVQEQLAEASTRAPAENDRNDRDALIALVAFADSSKARDRRTTAAAEYRDGMTSNSLRYHEPRLGRVLANLLLAIHHQAEVTTRAPSLPFPDWLEPWTDGLRSWPSVSPADRIRPDRTLDDAALRYIVPHPATHPNVRFTERGHPSENSLSDGLVQAAQKRTAELVEIGGRNMPKVSVEYVELPQLDSNLMTMTYHQESWVTAKAFHDVLPLRPDDRKTLSSKAAELSSTQWVWPNNLCLHGVVTLQHEGKPYAVWTQRQTRDPEKTTFNPSRWSCSFEEQFHPGESFPDECRRALKEEMVGEDWAQRMQMSLVALAIEQSILNLAPMGYAHFSGSWGEFLAAYVKRSDENEHHQVAALPLTRETLLGCAVAGDIPVALRAQALVGTDRQRFEETKSWLLHPTSLTRFALALWVIETLGRLEP